MAGEVLPWRRMSWKMKKEPTRERRPVNFGRMARVLACGVAMVIGYWRK